MEILFVHLLNNYTGSPRVLANVLRGLIHDDGVHFHLLTSFSEGALSEIDGVAYHDNHYKWTSRKILLAVKLLFSQIYQFFFVLFSQKYDLVYVNTILPFGSALAAKFRGMKIIYHIHEYYPNPNLMQKVCVFFARKCASEIVFVSEYLKTCYENKFKCPQIVIYNSVAKNFHETAQEFSLTDEVIKTRFENKRIVMPCSLKKYKGVFEFIKLADKMPDFSFELIVSNSAEETKFFFKNFDFPKNLTVKNEIKDMAKIYGQASLVMNLSIPHGIDRIIETFSMILLEGFEYGLPCIAPNYGGPKEVCTDGKSGFLVEPLDTETVAEKIVYIFRSLDTYTNFSNEARKRAESFSYADFISSEKKIIWGNSYGF